MLNAYVRKSGNIDVVTDTDDFPQLGVSAFILLCANRFANREAKFGLGKPPAMFADYGQANFEEPRR